MCDVGISNISYKVPALEKSIRYSPYIKVICNFGPSFGCQESKSFFVKVPGGLVIQKECNTYVPL